MKEAEIVGWGYASPQYLPQMYIKYRMNSKDFQRFWDLQDGKCAGCGVAFAHPFVRAMKQGVKAEIDHKHLPEHAKLPPAQKCELCDVRGLLCRRCNDFLGKVQDNQATLKNLVVYLQRHGDWNA